MPSPQRSMSPDAEYGQLAWGCRILIEPWTRWPLSKDIVHASSDCECKNQGGERLAVCVYLFSVAYDIYYKRDSELYSIVACNELVKAQANRLGLDLKGLDMWNIYPQFTPPGPIAPAA